MMKVIDTILMTIGGVLGWLALAGYVNIWSLMLLMLIGGWVILHDLLSNRTH